MRTLKRNQRSFYYCLYQWKEAITDEYGNETGETRIRYAEPVQMMANISPATGNSSTEQFGNLDNYDKVMVTDKLDCPIDENSVLFIDKEPEHNTKGDPMFDYVVRRVAKSLNSVSIAVSKVAVT